MLNTITHGQPSKQPPLVIAHGLFGSARNWGVIAKRLSDTRQVIAVDMRNHGHSPRFNTQTYGDMAADLAQVIQDKGPVADVLGHSMGGKAAMVLALQHPDLVHRLIVADIAPVAYGHSQAHLIEAMQAVNLDLVNRRADAGAQMGDIDESLKAFLLQSLDISNKGWLLNLTVLQRDMATITGFPDISGPFTNPTLFVTGDQSDYVKPTDRARIMALFPQAQFSELPGVGHWLHAEKPREFEAAVREFLDA